MAGRKKHEDHMESYKVRLNFGNPGVAGLHRYWLGGRFWILFILLLFGGATGGVTENPRKVGGLPGGVGG